MTAGIACLPVEGIGEVREGDDLAALLTSSVELHDGDVLVVTSKVVSKSEGRVTDEDRTTVVERETDRVLASRSGTSIVRTRHGLVMAAAGVDASNTEPGRVVALPQDPDESARALRDRIRSSVGSNVAVVVTDTSGRAWRNGQTDIAVGAAGLEVMHDYAGVSDDYGNRLAVTRPAVADEIAAAGDLVKGKLTRVPAAVVRGLGHLVLPASEHGPGARALVRDQETDMFGYGAREAVMHAVLRDEHRGFGAPAAGDELTAVLRRLTATSVVDVRSENHVEVHLSLDPAENGRLVGALHARLVTVAFALGWDLQEGPDEGLLRFVMRTP